MPSVRGTRVLVMATSLVFLLPFVSAHGDEASSGLANYQVLGIAMATAVLAFPLFSSKFYTDNSVFTPAVFSFAVFTGMVHVLLGINDRILLIGGVSVMAILLLSVSSWMDEKKTKISRLALGGVTITMFIGYFVSNHDLHYVLEDYLGITTKLSEIALLIGIYKSQVTPNKEKSEEVSA
ncbi:MAG: hypothetical protein VXV89_07385 [Candidatus Thermoplasmatota archaeon]|nr:hypothetical protein [Candidatus Thermoplasmatota archaeon]